MPSITSANVANAIVKLVAADALPALVGNLVMGNLVNRDYEPTLAQAGDTVNVPIAPQLVANNIAEGGAVQPQNPISVTRRSCSTRTPKLLSRFRMSQKCLRCRICSRSICSRRLWRSRKKSKAIC